MDLTRVCVTTALLICDRDTLAFLLGLDNESSWYWNLPLEDALVTTLGMNPNNLDWKPNLEWIRVAKCLDISLLKA